ncbi:hypothetical protein VB776_08630 [Arcicella sp. DC2W]|uniref:Lipoprotein n=1 Tax=Arcicella gelida TaxID=2984195 RepID=A0ABU5S3G4_9BACT|nr:hypothetical protein [Arcicella sp. DC2W]MEA5402977.1 hypothetical protein [Arcicella sp. DC2W]
MKKLSIILIILLMIYGASCSTNGYYPRTRKFFIKGKTVDSLGNSIANVPLFFEKIRSKTITGIEILDSLSFKTDANGDFLFSREYEHKMFQDNNCNAYYISPKVYNPKIASSYSFTGECKGDSIIFRQLIFLPK